MTYYPSRSGSPLGHQVIRTETGRYSCSCESRSECWAVQKERAKDRIAKITGKVEPVVEYKLPDMDAKRREQIAYADEQKRLNPPYVETEEDFRQWQLDRKELYRASGEFYKTKELAVYYRRFV